MKFRQRIIIYSGERIKKSLTKCNFSCVFQFISIYTYKIKLTFSYTVITDTSKYEAYFDFTVSATITEFNIHLYIIKLKEFSSVLSYEHSRVDFSYFSNLSHNY